MTRAEKKAYLKSYKDLGNDISYLDRKVSTTLETIHELRERQQSIKAVGYDGMPHGSGVRDALAEYAADLDKIERRLSRYIKRLKRTVYKRECRLQEIEQAVERVHNPLYKTILTEYYINGRRWADIVELTYYSERHVARLLNEAIDSFTPIGECQ